MSSSSYNYLTKKYKELGLLDESDHKILKKGSWDPFIYPDNGYIPPCSVCKNSYDDYVITLEKDNSSKNYTIELEWSHYKCGCLWADYYENKLKSIKENIRLIKKI